jgi:hypothetical protein
MHFRRFADEMRDMELQLACGTKGLDARAGDGRDRHRLVG